jgi:hypothetical protein
LLNDTAKTVTSLATSVVKQPVVLQTVKAVASVPQLSQAAKVVNQLGIGLASTPSVVANVLAPQTTKAGTPQNVVLKTQVASPTTQAGLFATEIAKNTLELIMNAKQGTDWSSADQQTVDPYGKAVARLGASPTFSATTEAIRQGFSDIIWKPKTQAETFVSTNLQRSPIPGSRQTLESLRFGREFLGLDTPENAIANFIPEVASGGGTVAAIAAKRGKNIFSLGEDMALNLKGLIKGVAKVASKVSPTETKAAARKVVSAAVKSTPSTSSVKKATSVTKKTPTTVVKRAATTRKVVQDTTTARKATTATAARKSATSAKAKSIRQELSKAATTRLQTSDIARLGSSNNVGKATSNVLGTISSNAAEVRQALGLNLEASAKSLGEAGLATVNKWTGLKTAAAGALGGAGATVGLMTLGGLLGEEEVANPGDTYGNKTPDPTTQTDQQDDQGGEWGVGDDGYTYWTPSDSELEDLPDTVSEDIPDGGSIVTDADGNPYEIVDSDGNVIRTLTADEVAAVKSTMDENEPAAIAAEKNWIYIAAAGGLLLAGAGYYLYKNWDTITNKSRTKVGFARRDSLWM